MIAQLKEKLVMTQKESEKVQLSTLLPKTWLIRKICSTGKGSPQ
jgi:hypothetical protein